MGNINDNDILYCLDAKAGAETWKKSYPCPLFAKSHEGGPCATPTVDGNAVYTFSKNGDAIRFDAGTGAIVWHRNLHKESGVKHPTWYFSGSPLAVGDLVILNTGTYGVALNKADGAVAWRNGRNASGYATAVPLNVGGLESVEVVGLNPTTGKVLWKIPWKTSYDINAVDPIVSGNTVFISSGYNKGCALYRIEGRQVTRIWQNKNMRNQLNSSVLWEGYLYGFDGQVNGGGRLTCVGRSQEWRPAHSCWPMAS
jgi:outer membrane protein assembly factor BamB